MQLDGSFTYIPVTGYDGPDSFTYKVNDGAVDGNTATVSLSVHAGNSAPMVIATQYPTDYGKTLQVPEPGLLSTATDGDGDSMKAILVSPPSRGGLTVHPDGSFTYLPEPNFAGTVSFGIQVTDGKDNSATAVFSIEVLRPPSTVSLNNNGGLGDAGIFQYYTVNSGWQTFMRIINTSANAVSVKVRFREAANSREVLDFIVFLSPYDVWAGWTDVDATNNGKPGVRTLDSSCLYPLQDSNNSSEGWKTISNNQLGGDLLGADFQDRAFTGDYDDGGNAHHTSLQRMSEGHVEVIGIAQHSPSGAFGRAVTHNHTTGKPSNCDEAGFLFEEQIEGGQGSELGNVLAMNGYVINVTLGQGGGFNPDILADFSDRSLVNDTLLTATDPDLDSSASNGPYYDRTKQKGFEGELAVTGGVDAVSWELQRAAVINEWAASANPGNVVSDYYTQWVLTFPTRHYYVDLQDDAESLDDISPTLLDPDSSPGSNDAYRPFDQEFDQGDAPGMACEPYRMRIWNREEATAEFTSPVPVFPLELCNETNVLVFNEFYLDKGLDSPFSVTIPEQLLPVDVGGKVSERGWASMEFYAEGGTDIDTAIEAGRTVFSRHGLPVTGWLFSIFNTNDKATNHTTISAHQYRRIEVEE